MSVPEVQRVMSDTDDVPIEQLIKHRDSLALANQPSKQQESEQVIANTKKHTTSSGTVREITKKRRGRSRVTAAATSSSGTGFYIRDNTG